MESRGVGCVVENEECLPVAANAGHGLLRSWHYAWAQAVLLLLAVIAYLSVYYRGPVPLKQSFATFPSTIGQRVATRGNREKPFLRAAGAEEELHRIYVGSGKERLHLYVAYFEYQQQGKEAVSYLTSPLHQWARTLLPVVSGDSEVAGNRKFAANKCENREILFWYDINGRILANSLTAKASTIWDALTRGRTNGALVMVYRDPDQNLTQESNSAALRDFADEVLPILRNYL